jgi:hypothetical protein
MHGEGPATRLVIPPLIEKINIFQFFFRFSIGGLAKRTLQEIKIE